MGGKDAELRRFSTTSGTMKVSAKDAVHQLGLEINSFNAWAAVTTNKYSPSMSEEDFSKTYGISKKQASQLDKLMYGGK
jgi:hypothetical protein